MGRVGTLAMLAALAPSLAAAQGIEIEQPWVRASLGRAPNSAAYMVIRSDAPDRLLGAATPAAERIELHNQMEHAGVQQMRRLDALEIRPGQPAVLQPGGLHLMLFSLSQRLEDGKSIPLVLTFEQAGEVEVRAEVRGLRAATGSGPGHGHGTAHPAPGERPGRPDG